MKVTKKPKTLKMLMPSHVKKLKSIEENTFVHWSVIVPKPIKYLVQIKLSSGGYLVINPTEALVSIDVNSGSSIKQKMLRAQL